MYNSNQSKSFKRQVSTYKSKLLDMVSLISLVLIYLLNLAIRKVSFGKIELQKNKSYTSITKKIDHQRNGSISRMDLIEISVRNMQQKRARAMVTIGGMAIGISAIVFLVSIGYGLQEVVVSRVARLEEMRQADLAPQARTKTYLTDTSLSDLKQIKGVEDVLPLISVVGKVTFNSSVSDVVVYGVTSKYLDSSAVKPIYGALFASNELVAPTVTLTPTPTAVKISPSVIATPDPNSEWINIDLNDKTSENVLVVTLNDSLPKTAVVNRSFLRVLGVEESSAVGKEFEISFVAVGELLPDGVDKLQSTPTKFKISAVTPDAKTPVVYVPIINLKSLGISRFSQVKIITKNEESLSVVRKQVEAMGFTTRSVVDTVAQINSLFATARIFLLVLGMVALSVAALGMFNTLTVSLLERTREVGLLKALGMRSAEIQELFFTESIIMGLVGGIFGLLGGYLAGKIISVLISVVSLSRGVGFIDISYLPLPFLLTIMGISLLVGILTGMYPASRATKISALNALRYE